MSSALASQTLWAKQSEWRSPTQTAPETKGWILGGEQSFIPSAKRAFSKVIHAFARNPQNSYRPYPTP
jgi:ethanolamine utilization microcompartment shell protein EutL